MSEGKHCLNCGSKMSDDASSYTEKYCSVGCFQRDSKKYFVPPAEFEAKKTKPKIYFHVLPIPMDDEDLDRCRQIGEYNWLFEQAELKNIYCDYIEVIEEEDTRESNDKKKSG